MKIPVPLSCYDAVWLSNVQLRAKILIPTCTMVQFEQAFQQMEEENKVD